MFGGRRPYVKTENVVGKTLVLDGRADQTRVVVAAEEDRRTTVTPSYRIGSDGRRRVSFTFFLPPRFVFFFSYFRFNDEKINPAVSN